MNIANIVLAGTGFQRAILVFLFSKAYVQNSNPLLLLLFLLSMIASKDFSGQCKKKINQYKSLNAIGS